MKLVAMQCHNCGAPLEQSDISEQLAVAKCSHCSAIFSIEKDDDTPQAGKAHRQEVPMPKGLVIHNLGSRLEIVRRWLSPVAIPLVIFCVFWESGCDSTGYFLRFLECFHDRMAQYCLVIRCMVHVSIRPDTHRRRDRPGIHDSRDFLKSHNHLSRSGIAYNPTCPHSLERKRNNTCLRHRPNLLQRKNFSWEKLDTHHISGFYNRQKRPEEKTPLRPR